MMNIKKITSFTVIFFLLALALLILYRIHFTLDFYDEPFYIAMTYHYIQGGKPFVDEFNVVQPFSLLLYPIFYVFYVIHKSTFGIILFSRYLYVIFTLGVFATLLAFLKRIMDLRMAMLIAFLPVAFTPFFIYSLSYNTLSSLFLLAGIIALFSSVSYRERPLISGLLIGGACFCYFPFTVLALFLFLLIWIYRCSWKFTLYYFLGLCICGSILTYFLVSAGFSNLEKIYLFSTSVGVQGGGLDKILNIFLNFYHAFPHKLFFTSLYVLAFFVHRFFKPAYFFASILMILILVNEGWVENYFMIYLSLIGLIAPLIYIFAKKHPLANRILLFIWLPGFVGGCISAWASGNGWYNTIIGGLAMPVATLLFVALLSEQAESNLSNTKVQNFTLCSGILFLMLILVALTRSDLMNNYGDQPIGTLQKKIESGPFSGLYTTSEKYKFLSEMQTDLSKVSSPDKSVLFFDDFPSGYLLTTMRPQTNTVWLFSTDRYPSFNKNSTLNYFQESGQFPDVIVQVLGVADNPQSSPYSYKYNNNDPFLKFIQTHYRQAIQREKYIIYLKN